jgi:ketosteroid isomerase-like protein
MTLSLDEMRTHAEALIAALNARDFDAIAASPWFDDSHAEFRSAIATSEGEVYRGVEGLRRWAANIDETWDDFRIEIVELHRLGDDRTLTVLNATGRAKASGVPLDLHTAQIWTWKDGVMVSNDSFTDIREAFEAAGLPYDPSTRST